jgi:hypothetical protein
MLQMTQGLPEEESVPDVASALDSTKWYLWHGNVFHLGCLLAICVAHHVLIWLFEYG